MYTWWANSVRTIDAAHAAAIVWNGTLWNGAVAGNGFRDHVTAGVAMSAVTTVEVTQATGLQTFRRDSAQVIPGVAVGNAMPGDVALVVSLRTATANRSGRGRFYLPQPAASQVQANGRVLQDLVADVNDSLSAAYASYVTGLDRPVIYSRKDRQVRNIVSWDIGDLYDTQRRRQNKLLEVRASEPMP